jgi:hypothetical protein
MDYPHRGQQRAFLVQFSGAFWRFVGCRVNARVALAWGKRMSKRVTLRKEFEYRRVAMEIKKLIEENARLIAETKELLREFELTRRSLQVRGLGAELRKSCRGIENEVER